MTTLNDNNPQILTESLLRSDFTFGFELEAVGSEDRFGSYYEDADDDDEDLYEQNKDVEIEISSLVNELFHDYFHSDEDGEMQHDGSINVSSSGDCPFEWASPVLDCRPENFANTIKFLKAILDNDIYTNSSCGFHHHLSWKGITERDMIWTYTNLAMDTQFIHDLAHLKVGDEEIFLGSEHWASQRPLAEIKNAVLDGNYLELLKLYSDDKYRFFRIHPYGTIEWRGPRDFLNDGNIKIIKGFYRQFYTLLDKVIQCQNMKTIDGTNITKEEFFNKLKEAQQDPEAIEVKDELRDGCEFLYRTGAYRGDRKLRYKREDKPSIDTDVARVVDKVMTKPQLFYQVIERYNNLKKLADILNSAPYSIKNIIRELAKKLGNNPKYKMTQEFKERLYTLFYYMNLAPGYVADFNNDFWGNKSEEQVVDANEYEKFATKLLIEQPNPTFLHSLLNNNMSRENKTISYSELIKIMKIYLGSSYSVGSLEYRYQSSLLEQFIEYAYKAHFSKSELHSVIVMCVKYIYKNNRNKTFMNHIYDISASSMTTNEEKDNWNKSLLAACFAKPFLGPSLFQFFTGELSEEMKYGLIAYISQHRDNEIGWFNDSNWRKEIESCIARHD